MLNRIASLAVFVAALPMATPLLSHEFWLEPEKFQVETDAPLTAHWRNGETFKGITLPYFATRSESLQIWQNGLSADIVARNGDLPAVQIPALQDGLASLSYQSGYSTVTYKDDGKFERFIKHKDLEAHVKSDPRALPMVGLTEVYKRFCKTLVAVGSGAGEDVQTGMETEFVALANPYLQSGPIPVRLLYQGAPRKAAQIEVFERAPDGAVQVFTLRTDAQGDASVPTKSGHEYLLDAVVLRVPDPDLAQEYDALWETLWASLTFHAK